MVRNTALRHDLSSRAPREVSRLTLVISNLGSGGAERVMWVMANYWAEHGREVTLITLSPESHDWYKLHPRVKRIALDLFEDSRHMGEAIWNNIQRVVSVRREIIRSQPQVVVCFTDVMNVLTLLACVGLKIPVIVSERTEPRHHSIGRMWRVLRSWVYPMASALVIQTAALSKWAAQFLKENAIHVIPNPVQPNLGTVSSSLGSIGAHRTVVAVGRLGREKGYDLLVEAFGRCLKVHPEWTLVIVGEGEERGNLEAMAKRLDIQERVQLVGRMRDPIPVLKGADLFVLSSRYEGFPNALLEAMACGLPAVATDCPNGPREIIDHGVNGLLVQPDNVQALTEAMCRLMGSPSDRERLGSRSCEVRHRYGVSTVMRRWDELIASTRRVSKNIKVTPQSPPSDWHSSAGSGRNSERLRDASWDRC